MKEVMAGRQFLQSQFFRGHNVIELRLAQVYARKYTLAVVFSSAIVIEYHHVAHYYSIRVTILKCQRKSTKVD
jgi:hypothetical protein